VVEDYLPELIYFKIMFLKQWNIHLIVLKKNKKFKFLIAKVTVLPNKIDLFNTVFKMKTKLLKKNFNFKINFNSLKMFLENYLLLK